MKASEYLKQLGIERSEEDSVDFILKSLDDLRERSFLFHHIHKEFQKNWFLRKVWFYVENKVRSEVKLVS